MVCLDSRRLNFRSMKKQYALIILYASGNYAIGHKARSQLFYLFYLFPQCSIIGSMGFFLVEVADLSTMGDGGSWVRSL